MFSSPFSRRKPAARSQEAAPPGRSAPGAGEAAEVRLVARVAEADLAAFEALYRLYQPRLARFLERVTRRTTLVEELLNDTMLVTWNQAARFNGSCKVSTWIFAIAYRKALKALSRLDEAMDDPQALEHPDEGAGPEQQWSHQELRMRLLQAMDQLSAEQRAVVDLTYFHGLGYREIAEIVDCPLDTVKTRMFHARRRLRTMFAGSLADWL